MVSKNIHGNESTELTTAIEALARRKEAKRKTLQARKQYNGTLRKPTKDSSAT